MPSESFADPKHSNRKEKMFSKNTSQKKKQSQKVIPMKKGSNMEKSSSDSERYVVVVTNVENDFAKIHQSCLPSYFGLAPNLMSSGQQRSSTTVGASTRTPSCTWELKCRSETRSAQLTISGPAQADVGSVFSYYYRSDNEAGVMDRKNAAQSVESETSEKKKGSSFVSSTKEGMKDKNAEEMGKEKHHLDQNTDEKESDALPVEEHLISSHSEKSFQKRLAFLQSQPYFGFHLRFHPNIPGRKDGEVLCRSNSRKRDREEAEKQKADEVEEEGKRKDGGVILRQSLCSQNELATAVASVSISWHTKELQSHLKDLPGFISCWYLYSRHFRVVFVNTETLFKAKKLLDEFEIEGNARVNLRLSDSLLRKYDESLLLENDYREPMTL